MEKEVREDKSIIDIENIKKIIEDSRIYFLNKINIEELTFNIIGGEIFSTEPSYLNQIINIIKSTNFENKIIKIKAISSLLIKNIEDYSYFLKNIDFIGTSYDPNVKRFNSKNYEVWKKNILYCQNNNIKVFVNITMTKHIINKEKEILDELILNNHIYNFHFGYFVPYLDKTNLYLMPSFEESSNIYINVHKYLLELYINGLNELISYSPFDGMCNSIKENIINESTICEMLSSFNINTDGMVGTCDAFGGKKDINQQEIVGNIFNNSLLNISKSKEYKKLYFHTMKVNTICINCEFQKQCFGSCRILENFYDNTQSECFGFKKFWEYSKEYLRNNKNF
jgi:radical SAM protein with 4Fe4S-binding SPASM domain